VRRLAALQTTHDMNPPPPRPLDPREVALDRLILAARRVIQLSVRQNAPRSRNIGYHRPWRGTIEAETL